MAEKWRPQNVLEREAKLLLRRVASQVASSAPRVAHRDGKVRGRGQPGGSLVNKLRSVDMLEVKPWGVVIKFASLGQKFLWFVNGTKRQKARPVELTPDVSKLTSQLEDDAARFYDRVDAAVGA